MTLILKGTERDAFGTADGKLTAVTDALLPRAYGNCTCSCHRTPGVYHCVPCCHFPLDDGVHTG